MAELLFVSTRDASCATTRRGLGVSVEGGLGDALLPVALRPKERRIHRQGTSPPRRRLWPRRPAEPIEGGAVDAERLAGLGNQHGLALIHRQSRLRLLPHLARFIWPQALSIR